MGCFTDAFETGDVDAILAMLVEDATFAMPPHATLYRGRDAIAASWLMPDEHPRLALHSGMRKRAAGVRAYQLDPGAGSYLPIALDVLTLRGDATGGQGETGVLVCEGVSDGLFGQASSS